MPPTACERFDAKKSINANFIKKVRYTPPNAGKGRSRGQKNIVTQSVREIFHEFVYRNAGNAQSLFDRVSKRDPAKALQILTNLADFVLPRLQRTEMTVAGSPLISPNPIANADEAAATYAAILGNTQFDLTVVRSAPPTQAPIPQDSVVAIQPAPPDNVVGLFNRLGKE
jgi:hypothetical protein